MFQYREQLAGAYVIAALHQETLNGSGDFRLDIGLAHRIDHGFGSDDAMDGRGLCGGNLNRRGWLFAGSSIFRRFFSAGGQQEKDGESGSPYSHS
jgi:hypothetical protein